MSGFLRDNVVHKRTKKMSGAIAVLAAIVLVPTLILLAFVLSLGHILIARQELQKAADSAALAGASQIFVARPSNDPFVGSRAKVDIEKAVSEAQRFCLLNTARGVNLNLLTRDVVVGNIERPQDLNSGLNGWVEGRPYPNAVQVTVRRDSSVNSPLPIFLGNFLGMLSWNGSATATACASRSYRVTGFNSTTKNAPLLPIAVDVQNWNSFLKNGQSPDRKTYDEFIATDSRVNAGRDEIPEFELPNPDWICIGKPETDTNALREWVLNGASPEDLSYFGPQGMQSATSSPEVPGTKSTLIGELQSIIGQSRVIPLYSKFDGRNYTLAGFAGIVITDATGTGSNMRVRIQPKTIITSTATFDDVAWSGTNYFVYPTSPLGLVR